MAKYKQDALAKARGGAVQLAQMFAKVIDTEPNEWVNILPGVDVYACEAGLFVNTAVRLEGDYNADIFSHIALYDGTAVTAVPMRYYQIQDKYPSRRHLRQKFDYRQRAIQTKIEQEIERIADWRIKRLRLQELAIEMRDDGLGYIQIGPARPDDTFVYTVVWAENPH